MVTERTEVAPERRRDLMRRRLFDLERESVALYAELATLHDDQPLPGLYLVLEAVGFRALLPAVAVAEIVRLVAITPLPDAPRGVLGTFIYRGTILTVLDLATLLGRAREPSLDSHVLVLASSKPIALIVDRVDALVQSPVLAEGAEEVPAERQAEGAVASLAVAQCKVQDEALPLIAVEPLARLLAGGPA